MTDTRVAPIPPGMHSLTPHIVCAGAIEAIAFYAKAFNAVELTRLMTPDGTMLMHAAVRIGDSVMMLMEESPKWNSLGPKTLGNSPVTLHLYVQDADAVFAQAVAAGATVVMPVTDMFWGDRYGALQDPFGHRWAIATHTRDLSDAEIREGMKAMSPGCD